MPLAIDPRRRDALTACGTAVVALVVYLWSLLPGAGYSGDTAKWQFIGRVGGISHATGYPLYMALDQAWVRIVPWGSLAWRVNLLSAVLGAAAVGVLFVVIRLVEVSRPVAVAAALVFAFSGTYWSQAVVAEVYTLHILFLTSVTACLAYWRKGAGNGWLLGGMALYALSFGHHLTTGLALPGVLWLVWSQRQRAVSWRNGLFVAVALVLSATQYLYLLHLSDTGGYHEAYIDTFGDIVDYVTGGSFKDSMFNYSWYGLLVARVPLVFRFVRQEYVVLLVPAAVGMWRGLGSADRALRDISIYLASLAACTAFYVMNFDVPDVVVFALPLFLSLAVFLGVGVDAAITGARRRWPDDRRVGPALAVGLVGLVVAVAALDYSRASQRGETEAAERMERAIRAAGSHAVLLTEDYHESELAWYYLLGEGEGAKRDLAVAHQVTPAQVQEYFATRRGPVAIAANQVTGTTRPALFTTSAHQAVSLAGRGMTITEVAPSVWEIGPPGR